jgi:hypothetical protein
MFANLFMHPLYPAVIFATVTRNSRSIGMKNIFLNKSFLIKMTFLFMAFLNDIYYIKLFK